VKKSPRALRHNQNQAMLCNHRLVTLTAEELTNVTVVCPYTALGDREVLSKGGPLEHGQTPNPN